MNKNNFIFNLIASDTPRSRAYIDQMIKNGLLPKKVIFIKKNSIAEKLKFRANPYFDNETNLLNKLLSLKKIKIENIKVNSSNDIKCLRSVINSKEKFFIFSSNPGEILRKEYFDHDKTYLHVHPGKLPKFKGSTPYYYEILNEKKITFTSLIMSHKLDEGRILLSKSFNAKKLKHFDKSTMDDVLDPYFRSLLLIETLKKCQYKKKNFTKLPKKNNRKYLSYFVIHPVLKNIAIFRK
tara:strand:+ start:47 stop:760 length:714 start_codon:yes stop_codon:yes gene_type:complete